MQIQSIQSDSQKIPVQSDSPTKKIIKDIASNYLKEQAVSLTLGGIVSCFVPTAAMSTLKSGLAIQSLTSLFFHSLRGFAKHKEEQSNIDQMKYKRIALGAEALAALNFAAFTGSNAQLLIHEIGHYLAAHSLIKFLTPASIMVFPYGLFGGGAMQTGSTEIRLLGKMMGQKASGFLIYAAGPALALLSSTALLATWTENFEKRPFLSKYLYMCGMVDFARHAMYAASAIGSSDLGNDFVQLSRLGGLHPIVSTIGILAIPVFMVRKTLKKLEGLKTNDNPPLLPSHTKMPLSAPAA